ncbi:hypothetical protein MLD38_019698 [Melastoma candidum]|uniref:Uncharacterized protein n=1 Tax=Melastoma candidum TaxID=119954 RepID=A0ACB9R0X8_9MYRT|nr:hypothetical protein MLD38_019698 [Melastoma candidum]
MATANPFDILGDNENDASQLIAAAVSAVPLQKPDKPPKKSAQAPPQSAPTPKLPSKPLPPAQAVREAKSDAGAGRGRGRGRGFGGGGRGFGRGRGGPRGYDQQSGANEGAVGNNDGFSGGYRPSEEGESGRPSDRRGGGSHGPFREGRRGGFSNGEVGEGERPRRVFERRSGTGRGNEFKREGAGRGNWGTATDEIAPETEEVLTEVEKSVVPEKQPGEEDAADTGKEAPANDPEEKEPEDNEMTLEEYEKVREEKRKALLALKSEERKVVLDKDLKNMHQLSNKKENNDVFIKLGSDKDRRKEAAEKEEKARKAVSINEFLKPADGQNYYNPGGRGRGRGRGSRGGYGGGGYAPSAPAPSIEDPGQFPSLGGK